MHPTPLNKNASTTPLKKGMVICNFDQEMLNDDTPYYDPYHLYNEDACQEEEELGMFSEKGLIKYKIEIYGKYSKQRSGTRMEHRSYRHSDFYDLIPLLMSSIESHLSNTPKQVFFLTQ